MKRRDALRGALAAGTAGPGLAAALSATRHDVDAALAAHRSSTDLGFWDSTAERYGHGYHGQSPAEVLAGLLDDFAELGVRLSEPQTVKARTALCHVTGRMAGMVAIVLHDLGHHREAHRWFGTASRAAEQSGDALLHAWVLAREAMVPLNYGAPQAAAELAGRARHLAGRRPSAAAALAAAVSSRALAAAGHREEARQAVADVEHMAERLAPEQRADTWFGYPAQKHHVHLSQALTLLGETDRAYETQRRALELSRTPSLMTRALIALDTATCKAQDGDREAAAHLATRTYTDLPTVYRTGLTRTRALALHRKLPTDTPGRTTLGETLETVA
ncbi:hypothetical protein ACFWIA_14320 [Streptomyces sp. NPDC127068]|uniref:hypothetical protein n=1 Tax=Streptomyces sp. NPDC127068 TaxID=3347127 RepID=UPI003655A275